MKPILFDGHSTTFGGSGYDPLPARVGVQPDGTESVVSCWRPSWRERLSILLFGRVWMSVKGTNQPPINLFGERDFLPPDDAA